MTSGMRLNLPEPYLLKLGLFLKYTHGTALSTMPGPRKMLVSLVIGLLTAAPLWFVSSSEAGLSCSSLPPSLLAQLGLRKHLQREWVGGKDSEVPEGLADEGRAEPSPAGSTRAPTRTEHGGSGASVLSSSVPVLWES